MASVSEFENHCWKDLIDEDLIKIYKSYERETFIGPNPALIGIDLYNLVYEGGPKPVVELVDEFPSSCGIYAWNAVQPTVELFQTARESNIPIIYSTRKIVSSKQSTLRKQKTIRENSYHIKEEFKPEHGDLIIYKERASCFFNTELADYLNSKSIDTVVMFGESTSGCVRASALDAYALGFHVVLVEECCFDRNLLSHKVNLFDMHHKYADVMHVTEVIQRLSEHKRVTL